MNNKLRSITAIFSLAAALTGCAGRRTPLHEIPEQKQPTLQEVFNLHAEAQAKPVPLDQAIDIFNKLSDMPDIAFNFPQEGCYARAHLMNHRMIEMGIVPKKVWAFKGDQPLKVHFPEQEPIEWKWHVASAIPTIMPNGDIQDLVIDPGLFNCPVSTQRWGKDISAPDDSVEVTPLGVSPKGREGDYSPGIYTDKDTDARALRTMHVALLVQNESPRKVFTSEFCSDGISQQQGRTWPAMDVIKR